MEKVDLNPAIIKTELLCRGVQTVEKIDKGRRSGAGPAGGQYFLLPDETCVDMPLQGKFIEKSPFVLVRQYGEYVVLKNGDAYTKLKAIPKPNFYKKMLSDGTPMRKIAVIHGKDCLASTVYSRCAYWHSGKQCNFCGIEIWHDKPIELKKPIQLAMVAEQAIKEGAAKHVTLTTGTPPTPDKGAHLLAEATKAIKSHINVPVHVQLEPPQNGKALEKLYDAGVNTVGIHAESFDEAVLAEVCPMKPKLHKYFESWKKAVCLFGEGQVSSFIIAGLGESDKSILNGVEQLTRIGVVPYLLPLRPITGTAFENIYPPLPERMITLYRVVAQTLHNYGLNPKRNKAGCVRCGACSAMNEAFEHGI